MSANSLPESVFAGIALIFLGLASIRWSRLMGNERQIAALAYARVYLVLQAVWFACYFIRNNSDAAIWADISDITMASIYIVAIPMFRKFSGVRMDRLSYALIGSSLFFIAVLGSVWTNERFDLHVDNIGALCLLVEMLRSLRTYSRRDRNDASRLLVFGFIFFVSLLLLRSLFYEIDPEFFKYHHQSYSNFVLASMNLTMTMFFLASLVVQSQKALRNMALHDVLTGVDNRRGLVLSYEALCTRVKRTESPYGVLVCDIDNFKAVNDTYGHAIGDVVLVNCVATMKKNLKETDLIGRVGGEEFVVVIADCSRRELENVVQCILIDTRLQRCSEEHEDLHYTVSIGGVHLEQAVSFDDAFRSADRNLYRAKTGGRNRAKLTRENGPESINVQHDAVGTE